MNFVDKATNSLIQFGMFESINISKSIWAEEIPNRVWLALKRNLLKIDSQRFDWLSYSFADFIQMNFVWTTVSNPMQISRFWLVESLSSFEASWLWFPTKYSSTNSGRMSLPLKTWLLTIQWMRHGALKSHCSPQIETGLIFDGILINWFKWLGAPSAAPLLATELNQSLMDATAATATANETICEKEKKRFLSCFPLVTRRSISLKYANQTRGREEVALSLSFSADQDANQMLMSCKWGPVSLGPMRQCQSCSRYRVSLYGVSEII